MNALPVRVMAGRDDSSSRRISGIHKYWARKPHSALAELVDRFSEVNDHVLDPFCGSGSMGLESILAGRKFVGMDLNPIACEISRSTLDLGFDEESYRYAVARITSILEEEILELYRIGDNFLVHAIRGPNQNASHNAVLADRNGKHRVKVLLAPEQLDYLDDISLEDLDYPDAPMPSRFYKDRFSYKGVRLVSDFFSKRSIVALSKIRREIMQFDGQNRDLLTLALSNTLLHVSKLKSENIRPLGVNNYWIPDDYIEENVWFRFVDRCAKVAVAKREIAKRAQGIKPLGKAVIHQADATMAAEYLPSLIDYVITDPPYGDVIQYSELSFIWNCWIESSYPVAEEIIINPKQQKGTDDYLNGMSLAIKSIGKVLKSGGYFTLCFQNKDSSIWISLAEIIRDEGFVLEEVAAHELLGKPYNHSWSKFSPKRDIYVTFKYLGKTRVGSVKQRPKPTQADFEEIWRKCDALVTADLINSPQDYFDCFVAYTLEVVFAGAKLNPRDAPSIENIVQHFHAEGRVSECATLF